MTSAGGEKVYDGNALTKPTVAVSGDGFVEGEVTDIKATGSVTTVEEGEVTNTITYTEGENFKADNYDITKTEGTLKITASEGALVITSSTKSWTYDGQTHTDEVYTVTYDGTAATADESGKVFTLSTGDTVTITSTAAGVKDYDAGYDKNNTFRYVITNARSYSDVTATFGTLSITPAAATVTITGNKDSLVYNGEEQKVEGYEVEIDNTLYTEDDFTFSGEAVAKGTDVNKYPMGLEEDQFTNNNTNFDVTFTVTDGELEITKLSITIKADDKTKVYDNDESTDPELTATITGMPKNGTAPEYSISREPGQDVGEYIITITIPTQSAAHNSGMRLMSAKKAPSRAASSNANYDITVENGTFTITPAEITIKADDKSKLFDNDPSTDPELTATVTGKPEKGVDPVYSLSREEGQQTGEYAITVTAEANDNPNYIVTLENGSFVIEYNPALEQTSIEIIKLWADNNNQDGIRPSEVIVTINAVKSEPELQLRAAKATMPTKELVPVMRVTITEDMGWRIVVDELNVYDENGEQIEYTVTEDDVNGYSLVSIKNEDGVFTITNTHAPEQTEVSVVKVWDDDANSDGIRPVSVQIQLYGNGQAIGNPVRLNALNNWTYTWTSLAKNSNGEKIAYSVTEVRTPIGYISTTSAISEYSFIVKNTHIPFVTDATVVKVWDDEDNADGIRPESIVMTLSNGTEEVEKVTLSEANGWKATVTGLQKYAGNEKIEYTWSESAVSGYVMSDMTKEGTTTTFTNKHIAEPKDEPGDEPTDEPVKEPEEPETVSLKVTKVWVDNNNADNGRPEYITVMLLGNGKVLETVKISESDGWVHEFTELAKYDENGKAITYGVMEETVENYMTIIAGDMETGITITNKYTAPESPVIIPDTADDDVESGHPVTSTLIVTAIMTLAGICFFEKKKHNA